jgi:hypothetical protein
LFIAISLIEVGKNGCCDLRRDLVGNDPPFPIPLHIDRRVHIPYGQLMEVVNTLTGLNTPSGPRKYQIARLLFMRDSFRRLRDAPQFNDVLIALN